MVHIGIDSVKLNGKGIQVYVSKGQKVELGDKLAKFDKEKFVAEGIDPTVVTLLLNAYDYMNVDVDSGHSIIAHVG